MAGPDAAALREHERRNDLAFSGAGGASSACERHVRLPAGVLYLVCLRVGSESTIGRLQEPPEHLQTRVGCSASDFAARSGARTSLSSHCVASPHERSKRREKHLARSSDSACAPSVRLERVWHAPSSSSVSRLHDGSAPAQHVYVGAVGHLDHQQDLLAPLHQAQDHHRPDVRPLASQTRRSLRLRLLHASLFLRALADPCVCTEHCPPNATMSIPLAARSQLGPTLLATGSPSHDCASTCTEPIRRAQQSAREPAVR